MLVSEIVLDGDRLSEMLGDWEAKFEPVLEMVLVADAVGVTVAVSEMVRVLDFVTVMVLVSLMVVEMDALSVMVLVKVAVPLTLAVNELDTVTD